MANLETSALVFRTDLMNMIKDIVWKNHYEASKYEKYVTGAVADEYVWAAQRLMEVFSSNQLKQIIEYNDSKFEALIQTVEDVYKRPLRIVRDYEEMNDYYRKLNGQPPLHYDDFSSDIDYGIKLSSVGLTPDIILRLGIEDIYSTAYLHDLTSAQLTFLESLGYIAKLMRIHDKEPQYDYLQYMTSKKIFPFVARIADHFDLLYVPKTKLQNLADDFGTIYAKCKLFMIQRYYTDAYRNKYEFYEGFVGLSILFMTIQQLNVMYLDTDITREFYDLDSIRVVYRAYSVPFYEDIPVAYHAKIVKAINRLLTYKGSNHIIFDLAALFDYGKLTIFQYYLMKQQNLNTDGTPHYSYNDIYDENGVYLESEVNYEETYDIHFVKRAIGKESPFEAINNPNNDLDYQAVIMDDHYWLDDADLREKMYQSEYNFIETKYLGLQTQISMTKFMYESCYFMRMLFDNRDIFENITVYNSKVGEDIPIFTTIIYLHALICKKLGWEENFNMHSVPGVEYLENERRCTTCYGLIPTEPTKIAKLLGFNFKADLTKIIYDCMVMDSRHTISFLDENGNGWYFYPSPIRNGSKWTGMDIYVYEMRDNVTISLIGTMEDFKPSPDSVARALLKVIERGIPTDISSKYRAGVFSTEDEYAIVFVENEKIGPNGEEEWESMIYDEYHSIIDYMFTDDSAQSVIDIFHNPSSITPMTAYKVDPEDMYELIFEPINWDVHASTQDTEDPAQPHELRSMGFGLHFISRDIVVDFLANTLGYTAKEIYNLFLTHTIRVKDASIDMFDNSFDKVQFIELLNAIDLESATSVNSYLGIASTYKGIIAIKEYIENRMFTVKDKDAFNAYKHLYKILMTCDILPDIIQKSSYKREVIYQTDDDGNIIYDTDESGNTAPKVAEYRKVPKYEIDSDGNIVTDDNGNPVPKRDSRGYIEYEHEIATSYADLLEDLDYVLAVRLMGLDTEYDLSTEIDCILIEIQRLCDDLTYIISYGSSNMEVIVEYLYKLIKFFKSVKAQFLDFNIIWVIDSRTDNLLKLMSDLSIGYKRSDITDDKSLAIATFDILNHVYDMHIVDDSLTARDTLLQFIMLMHLKSLVFKKDSIAFGELKSLLQVFLTIFDDLNNAKRLTVLAEALGDMINEMNLIDKMQIDRQTYLKSLCFKLDEIAKILRETILEYAGIIRFTDDINAEVNSRIEVRDMSYDSNIEHVSIVVGPGDPNNAKWWGYMLWNSNMDVFHNLSDGDSEGVISTEDDHAVVFDELEEDGPNGEEEWENLVYEEDERLAAFIDAGRPQPEVSDDNLDIFRLPSDGTSIGVFSTEDEYALQFMEMEPIAPYEVIGFTDYFHKKKLPWGIFADVFGDSVRAFYARLQDTGTITLENMLDFFSIRKLRQPLNLTDDLILDKYKIHYPDFGFAVPDDRTTGNQVAVITTEDEEIISDTATNYYGNWEEGTPFERRE